MTKLLLSIHVIAAILAVGPIAVAASMFPRFAKQADDERSAAIARVLHRICRGYAVFGIAVPVFGIATGAQLGVLTDAWLLVSIALTAIAAGVLALVILPAQRRLLDEPREMLGTVSRLAMTTGIFNVLWAVVVVLMIVRPGSTTGA
ncbi:hypothetical protein ABT337_23680 [Saccharopolyspora hirsuta]|uniref:DUF2269 family protein n=1 Tax=Saccharopolyspora hirsuta TaxID=1837 RepID=A0A5M7C2L6_SACHI|nr:hypothetical protein [Saccharopolyspora hirsuta]KAA5835973.1 hypothetical protein F1721_06370 [Saccharopolyspora hirsuta]